MELKPQIEFDDYVKTDLRVGTITQVFPVEGSEKLLRCLIDFGPELATETVTTEEGEILHLRQILSGIRPYYPQYSDLVGKQALYIVNLAPRAMMGYTSWGMLLAVGENDCVMLSPEKPVIPGSALH